VCQPVKRRGTYGSWSYGSQLSGRHGALEKPQSINDEGSMTESNQVVKKNNS